MCSIDGYAQSKVTATNGSLITGSGTITGTTQPQSGGRIAPGNGIGTLTLQALLLSAGNILELELSSSTSDFISITGSNQLTINGGGVRLYQPRTTNPFATPGTYPIMGYTGTLQGSSTNLQVLNPVNAVAYRFVDNMTAHTVDLTIANTFLGVVSRKTHGSAGTLELPLSLGSLTTEPRSGNPAGNHRLVFTFANPLTAVTSAAVTGGTGSVANGQIGSDAHEYIVDLNGVPNPQKVTVALTNISDNQGFVTPNLFITIGFLIGDANGDAVVNSADATITRNDSGQTANATNFRADYNLDGVINSADATIARNASGNSVAAPPQRVAR